MYMTDDRQINEFFFETTFSLRKGRGTILEMGAFLKITLWDVFNWTQFAIQSILSLFSFSLFRLNNVTPLPCPVRERSSGRGGGGAVSAVRRAGGAGGAMPFLVHSRPTAEGAAARGGNRRGARAFSAAPSRHRYRHRTCWHIAKKQ